MSDTILQASQVQVEDGVILENLSEEFRQVAERIQEELRGFSFGSIEPGVLAQVEAAEQVVDERALDLQRGVGERMAWQTALSEYETAWLKVLGSLGERKN